MTKIVTISCDRCNRDLTWTSNFVDYRIVLTDENIASNSVAVTSMFISPHIDGTKHFCNFKCLHEWVNKSK